MLKGTISRTVKRIFKWSLCCRKYREARKLSDHRAVNLATRLTISGALTPSRMVSNRFRHN